MAKDASIFKFKQGDKVDYVYGNLKGTGKIRGVAQLSQPEIGALYIIEDKAVSRTVYPYDCFACPEVNLKLAAKAVAE
jgi:hypothetical protein